MELKYSMIFLLLKNGKQRNLYWSLEHEKQQDISATILCYYFGTCSLILQVYHKYECIYSKY